LYKVDGGHPAWMSDPSAQPYFEHGYISLAPSEIYEAKISAQVDFHEARMVSYQFVISGSTPERQFTFKDPHVQRLSRLLDTTDSTPKYEHRYVEGYLAFAAANPACAGTRVKRWFAVPAGGLGQCP